MKTKIMFCLVLMALFGFSGNSPAIEETQQRLDATGAPSESDTLEKYDEIIGL